MKSLLLLLLELSCDPERLNGDVDAGRGKDEENRETPNYFRSLPAETKATQANLA